MQATNNTNSAGSPKHLKSFWPLMVILVIALLLCGAILYFVNGNIVQDDINSTSFSFRTFMKKVPVKKVAPKTKAVETPVKVPAAK